MRAISLAVLVCGAASLGACGTSGSNELRRTDPVRALLSADALMYGDFDANKDYQVTLAEVEAGVTAEFARADSNGDGSIGPIEFQTWSNLVVGGSMTPPYRLDFDRNVDNIITQEEFRNEIVARAQQYDSDENGAITRAEFIRNLNQARPAHRAPPSDVDAPNARRPPQ